VDFFNAHGKRVIAGAKTTVAYEAYIEDLNAAELASTICETLRDSLAHS